MPRRLIGGDLAPLLLVPLCAMLSIGLSGHQSGNNNNVYHLPVLIGLYDHPGLEHDAFVQSMRFYASGFWLLLRGMVARNHVLDVFLPLQIASRTLFFAGVLAIARPLGLTGHHATCLFLLFVAIAAPLLGDSPAGGGGMFIPAFTHSELANGTALLSLALAMRGRFGWALLAAGATFFLNMFMAVWLSPVLVALAGLQWREGTVSARVLVAQFAWGALACLPLVMPVIWNLAANPDFGHPPSFSYRTFLIEFWPYHFLIEWIPHHKLFELAALTLSGLAAAWALPRPAATRLAVTMGGFGLVWVIGALVSLATEAPLILNLHLLRSSALIVIMAVISIAALAAHWASGDPASPAGRADRWLWAPLLVLLLLAGPTLILLVPLVIAARAHAPTPALGKRPFTAMLAAALVTILSGLEIVRAAQQDRLFRAGQHEWLTMAEWTRTHTAPGATVSLPVTGMNAASSLPHDVSAALTPVPGDEVFESFSDRPLWVTYKQGAAVMWRPSYYGQWHQRLIELLSLTSPGEHFAYARRHGIALVIERCDERAPRPSFRTARLCAYRVSAGPAPRRANPG